MTTQNFFTIKKSFNFFTFRYKSASVYFNTFICKLLFVLLFLFIAVAAAYTQNVSTEDRNKDGKADRWIEHYGTGKVIIKSDNNYDDIIDSIVELDERGNKTYEEQDFNFDGKMDNFYYFTPGGVLMRQEIDSNYDGKIDIWIYLDKGVYINKIERDKDYDGKPDYAKIYRR